MFNKHYSWNRLYADCKYLKHCSSKWHSSDKFHIIFLLTDYYLNETQPDPFKFDGYFYVIKDNLNQQNISAIQSHENRIFSLEQNQSIQNQKISILESWKQTITNTLTDMWSAITSNTNRIEILENQSSQLPANLTIPDYWKYL